MNEETVDNYLFAGVGGTSTISPTTESSSPVVPPEAISALPAQKTGLQSQPSSEIPVRVTEDSMARNLPQQEIDYKRLSKPIFNIPQKAEINGGKVSQAALSGIPGGAPPEKVSSRVITNIPQKEGLVKMGCTSYVEEEVKKGGRYFMVCMT